MLTLEEVWAELQRVKGLLLQHAWRHDDQSAPDALTITTSAHARQHAYDSAADHSGTLSWAKVSKTGSSLADLATKVVTALTGGNWKLFYTDGSGDVTELALGADDRFLVSTGATSAPEFRALVAGDIPDVSATYQVVSEKDAASGYCGLNASSEIDGKTLKNPVFLDVDATPVDNVLVRVVNSMLGIRNSADSAYAQLDIADGTAATRAITKNQLDTHAAAADPHTGYQKESEKGAASGYASLDGSSVVEQTPKAHASRHLDANDPIVGGAKVANTTPSSFTQWASKSGDARKVLIWDDANSRVAWGYIQAFDVKTPSQIKTFSDGLSNREITDGAGTVTPSFTLTYESAAGCSALVVDVSSTGEDPDTGANYPDTLAAGAGDPYTAPTGEDVIDEEGTTVGSVVTFTATATVDSVANLTKTTTFTWLNRKYYGPDTKATALTTAEVLALDATGDGGSALDADYKGSWTVDADTNEYIWFAYRAALGGTPVFTIGGFEGGFSYIDTISHTNDSGFTENYKLYRSDNHSLGSTAVTVS